MDWDCCWSASFGNFRTLYALSNPFAPNGKQLSEPIHITKNTDYQGVVKQITEREQSKTSTPLTL